MRKNCIMRIRRQNAKSSLGFTFNSLSKIVVDTRGETITEVLAAIVIGGLAVLLLAVAITSSVRIVTDSKTTMGDYYGASNNLVEAENGDSATDVTQIEGSVVLKDSNGKPVLLDGAIDSSGEVSVVYYLSPVDSGSAQLVLYKKQ